MDIYDEMTSDERMYALESVLKEDYGVDVPARLLGINGLSELLLEELNNEILAKWLDEYTAECVACGDRWRRDEMRVPCMLSEFPDELHCDECAHAYEGDHHI